LFELDRVAAGGGVDLALMPATAVNVLRLVPVHLKEGETSKRFPLSYFQKSKDTKKGGADAPPFFPFLSLL
jgi:hypothetical protein